MRSYCRAYPLADLRGFPGWTTARDDQTLSDDTICYIWDDFSVVLNPAHPDSLIFDGTAAGWTEFCQSTLQFAVPDEVAGYQ